MIEEDAFMFADPYYITADKPASFDGIKIIVWSGELDGQDVEEAVTAHARGVFDPLYSLKWRAARYRANGVTVVRDVVIEVDGEEREMSFEEFAEKYKP